MKQKHYWLLLLIFSVCFNINAQYEDCPIAKDLVSQTTTVSDIPKMKIAPLTGPGQDDEVEAVNCLMPFDFDISTGLIDPNQILPYAEKEGKSYWFSFNVLEAGTFEMIITPDSVNGKPAGNFDFLIIEGGCPTDPCSEAVFCGALGPQACVKFEDPTAPDYGERVDYIPTGLADNPLADYGVVIDPTKLPEIWEAIELKANKNYYILVDHKHPDAIGFAEALGFAPCDYLDLGFTMEFGGTARLGPTQAIPDLRPIIPNNTTDVIPRCAFAGNDAFLVTEIPDADYIWTVPPDATMTGNGNEITVDYGNMSGQVCVTITCPVQNTLCWDITVGTSPVLKAENPTPAPCNSLTLDDYASDEENITGRLALFATEVDALGLQNELDPTAINIKGEYWITKITDICTSKPLEISTTPVTPKLQTIAPINICNTPYDLSTIQVVETNGFQASGDLSLPFFASESDANNEVNTITEAPSAGTYWVKAVTGDLCEDLISFELIDVTPTIAPLNGPQVGCQEFNLSSISLQTVDGAPITDITYFTDELDAENARNPLPSKIITSDQLVWARGDIGAGCFDVIPIDISISVPVIQAIAAIVDCGDSYSLDKLNLQARNNEMLDYTFHLSPEDAVNEAGHFLLPTVPIPTTIWIRGENATGCFDTLAVTISSADPTILQIDDRAECGNSFDLDNITVNEASGIDLSTTYYDNFANALNGTNAISNIITTSATYWIRGETATGCFDVAPPIDISLTVPNIQPPSNDRLNNGEYDLRDVQILDLDATEFLTGLTFYADSLSAVAGTPVLPPIVTEVKTYWIRGFVGTCPVIVPFGVEAESRATIPLTLAPVELPCNGDCINLQTYAAETLDPAFPNLNFLFFATKDLAEEGLPSNVLSNLEYCMPAMVWVRGVAPDMEFGLTELSIQDIERMNVMLVSGDRDICDGDTMNTNLLFQLSGVAPFTITYSDGTENFELNIMGDNFEHPVAPTVSTTYSLQTAKDANGCDAGPIGGTSTFTVIERVQIDTLEIICNDLQTAYTVSFNIMSGDLNSLSIDGNSGNLTNRRFVSDPIPIADAYSFTIADLNGCEPYITGGSWICACETEAAEMDQTLLEVCEGGTATAIITKPGVLTLTDGQFYILHDSETNVIGEIFGVTDDMPEFTYTSNLEIGKTYYISSVITKLDAVNLPITEQSLNPCIGIAIGTPVQFVPLPEVTLTLDKNSTCENDLVNLQFDMNGAGPYNLRYSDGTTATTLDNILNGHSIEVQVSESTTYTIEAINWSNIDNCQSGSINSAILSIAPALSTGTPILTCDDAGREYTISFDIIGGDPDSYLVDGSAANIVGNQFTSAPMMHESTYRFEVTDGNACEAIIIEDFGKCDCTADITADIALVQDISCAGESDGIVEVKANNGEAPFTFQWEDGSIGTQLTSISAGLISVSMTDANECEVIGTLQVDGPTAITPEIESRDPRCFGETNGSIIVRNVTGGTRPYMYALGNAAPSTAGLYGNLEAAIYTIQITDDAGCEYKESVELMTPDKLTVSLQENPTAINLGDSIQLQTTVNQNIVETTWQFSTPISCEDCLNPITKPIETARYVITVKNEHGCTAMDELLLSVTNDKKIFSPTSFSPNNDGVNDTFGLFGGGQVAEIKSLRVFNRWGALLYERSDLPAVYNFEGGWDGKDRGGKDAPSGIYIYAAEVLFKDGTTEMIRGDVAIMR